jgi:hypothetical protein
MVAEIKTQQVAIYSFFLDPREIDDNEFASFFFVISRVFQKTTNFQSFLAQLVRSKNAVIWPVLLVNRR